jgi:hypothetical protein
MKLISSLEISSTKCLSLALSNWLYILALYLWLCLCLWLYLWLCLWLCLWLSAPQLIQIDAFIPSLKYIEVRSVYFRHAKYVTIYVLTVLIIN